ncbi:putative cofactor assembly of complex C subunit B, CCB1 [Helianthus debilis subsp. tardiflorus]
MPVAKLLLPSSLNPPSKLTITRRPPPSLHRQPWGASKKNKRPAISASSLHETATVAVQTPLFLLADAAAAVGYSTASYYTSLGLFVISVPGLWSLIKRSVKSKVLFSISYLLINQIALTNNLVK